MMQNIKKNFGAELLSYVLIIFPISVSVSNVQFIGGIINKVCIALIFIALIAMLFANCSKQTISLSFFALILTIINVLLTNLPFRNFNEIFYLLIWVMYLNIFYDKEKNVFDSFYSKKKMVLISIVFWELMVMYSMIDPQSYQSGFFISYTGGQHRLCSSALLVITYILFFYKKNNKKKYLLLLVPPYICIFLSGARTYLAICLVLFVIIVYKFIKNELLFWFLIIPISLVMVTIVFNTSIFQQRLVLDEYIVKNKGVLAAFTSGRSVFWEIDIKHYMNSSFINQIIGNGFNFIRDINERYYGDAIWAHNDYINLLGCNGLIGLILYFISYFRILSLRKKFSDKRKTLLFVTLNLMLIINAFFNMLYTYLAAAFAIPFLVYFFYSNSTEARAHKYGIR